jgi:hypothetical protein
MKLRFWVITSLVVLAVVSGCQSIQIINEDKDRLLNVDFTEGDVNSCLLPVEVYHDVCFTSDDVTGMEPIDAVYKRFMDARKKISSEGNTVDINQPAICTYGFLLGCEFESLLVEYGFRRKDDLLKFQVMGLLAGYRSDYLREELDIDKIYPENYDPRKKKHFRQVLTESMKILKKHNILWRQDW